MSWHDTFTEILLGVESAWEFTSEYFPQSECLYTINLLEDSVIRDYSLWWIKNRRILFGRSKLISSG